MLSFGSQGPESTLLLLSAFQNLPILVYIKFSEVLVVLSGRNTEKHIRFIFPEAENSLCAIFATSCESVTISKNTKKF